MKRTVEVEVGVDYADLPSLLMEAAAIIESNPLQRGVQAQAEELKKAWAEIDALKSELSKTNETLAAWQAHQCDHSHCVNVKDYEELRDSKGFAPNGHENRQRPSFARYPTMAAPGERVMIEPNGSYNMHGFGVLIRYEGRGWQRAAVRPDGHGKELVIDRKYVKRMTAPNAQS